jgi:hypothetical protein
VILLAPQRFLLSHQAPKVPRRTLIARRDRDRQQPLARDPGRRLGHPLGHHVAHRVEIARPRRSLRPHPAGLGAFHNPLDRLMGGAAQLGGTTIRSDLPIGGGDVHSLPRRLQWNSLGGAGDSWRYRPVHESLGLTRQAREWGLLPGHQRGPTAGHQWTFTRPLTPCAPAGWPVGRPHKSRA